MEKFIVKINRCQKHDADGKFYVVFDVYTNGVKVGEAESEFSVFQGIMIASFQEAVNNSHLDNLKKMVQDRIGSV